MPTPFSNGGDVNVSDLRKVVDLFIGGRELDEVGSKKLGITVEEQQKRSSASIPLGRYGHPEEFARAVVFLLSNGAGCVTGASLQVDGGQIRSVL